MQSMNAELPKAKTLEAHLFSSKKKKKNQVHAKHKEHAKHQPTVLQFKNLKVNYVILH